MAQMYSLFFFFSSRRRHTRLQGDWSSDVCSSDLTVSVRGKALVLPASVIVAPGAQASVTLETTEPAPSAGLAVSLAPEQAGLAQVPASVQIPSGQSKAAFTVAGQTLGTTRITAPATR